MIKLPNINKLSKNIFVFATFFLILSISLQVFISNKYAVKGSEMVELTARKKSLEREVSKLNMYLSCISSMFYVETRARELGFVQFDGKVNTIDSVPVAAAGF